MTEQNGIVDWSEDQYAAFILRFPEFEALTLERVHGYWLEAEIHLMNDGTSPIAWAQRGIILNLMVAHIATLYAATVPGQMTSSGGLVGRISGATEGSVSVSVEPMGQDTRTMATWLNQTRYGAQLWAMLARFLTARYIPGPQPYLGVGLRATITPWGW